MREEEEEEVKERSWRRGGEWQQGLDERKETRGLKRKKAEEVKEGEKQLDWGNDDKEMMKGRGRDKTDQDGREAKRRKLEGVLATMV